MGGAFEGALDDAEEYMDDLAAGDEVAELAELLRAMESAASGSSSSGPQSATQVTDYATVPAGGERLAVPGGTTTIDFEDGLVKHEDLGIIDEVKSLDDMSGAFDGRLDAELRSVYAYADTPAKVRFNGSGESHVLDSCNYYPLKSQGFKTLTLSCPLPFEFSLTASTRRDAFDTSGVSVHMDRYGTHNDQRDSWTPVPLQPAHLHEHHGNEYGKPPVHVASFARSHFFVENTTGEDSGTSGNAIDVRVMARNNHPGSGRYYEVARSEGVPDGDHVSFDIAEKHHFLAVHTQNSTDGLVTASRVQFLGGAP